MSGPEAGTRLPIKSVQPRPAPFVEPTGVMSKRPNRKPRLALLPAFLLAACASPTIAPESKPLDANTILRAEPLTGPTDLPDVADVDVLALSDDMRAFLEEHVDPGSSGERRIRSLLYALLNESGVGVEYDSVTLTAQETFAAGMGNCLSFTNMFVAMARETGIKVTFQEVRIPPAWSLEGGTFVLSRHINAAEG